MVFRDEELEREDEEPEREESAPPTPITHCDMDVIIRGWEEKFSKLTECLREVQLAPERAGSDMCLISQEARAQGQDQERRLGTMQEGLADFLRRFETTRTPTTPHVDALRGEHATWDTAQNMPRFWIPAITSGPRRGFTSRTQHVAAHPECAHRGSGRQYGNTYGIRAQHVAAHQECAHRGSG